MTQGNWNFPTSIRFGAGRLAELPQACMELGMQRPLLVTDPGLARLDIVRQARAYLRDAGLGEGLFAEVEGNPVDTNLAAGVEAFRNGNHDGVVAMGGGSALDVGKAIALMDGQTLPWWEFEDIGDNYAKANADAIRPIVAVPTTSGTGSEVGRCSVIIHSEQGRKVVIFHPRMMPSQVVADPALTIGLPAKLTAAVGMDALSHNLEAFLALSYHPMADGIALEAIRLIHDWLVIAVREPTNIEARAAMMVASTAGATSFQKGLGAMHALSHPVSVKYGTHHGLTNGVVMPFVLEHNRPVIEERVAILSRHMGLAQPTFEAFLAWVVELRSQIGIPHSLAELGVTESDIPELAPQAAADYTAAGNPLPVDATSLAEVYGRTIRGELRFV
ncbi:MAG: alcohol dehydrogenase [Myxococcales bacterium]|nr:alcohol dehydrogenase [Myxococcales bacterium]